MRKNEAWKSRPVENEIIMSLINHRGEILTTDLYRILANKYQDFTRMDMMDYLFKLEVRSFIHVIPIKKDVLKVEINRNGNFSETIREKLREFMR